MKVLVFYESYAYYLHYTYDMYVNGLMWNEENPNRLMPCGQTVERPLRNDMPGNIIGIKVLGTP